MSLIRRRAEIRDGTRVTGYLTVVGHVLVLLAMLSIDTMWDGNLELSENNLHGHRIDRRHFMCASSEVIEEHIRGTGIIIDSMVH